MYPPKTPEELKAGVSQDNARDIVEAIDGLIIERILWANFRAVHEPDKMEMLKRRITDYLLVTDPRSGVFHESAIKEDK